MGGSLGKASEIGVATLNYAGITESPFEFYSGDPSETEELMNLSRIFIELIKKEENVEEISPNFQWEIKKIDTIMIRQRYCPLYRQDAGIIHGRLLSRARFEVKWREEFQKNRHYVKFKEVVSSKDIDRCLTYDFLIFKTFVEYIYNFKIREEGEREEIKLQDRDSENETRNSKQIQQKRQKSVFEYVSFLSRHFSKSYLKHQAKLDAVHSILSKIDVLFSQDVSDQLINSLKSQGTVNVISSQGSSCAILLKQEKFNKIYDQKKIFEELDWGDRRMEGLLKESSFNYDEGKNCPAVCFVDNFLLMSVHLPLKNNLSFITKMMKHLLSIKAAIPGMHIIVGGDFSRYIGDRDKLKNEEVDVEQFFSTFTIYPETEEEPTTRKRRTWLQSQTQKAQVDDVSCRDCIITDCKVRSGKIEVVEETKGIKANQLLTEKHPFDHYIVSATIINSS